MKLRYVSGLVGALSLFVASAASASTYTNSDRSFALSFDEIQRNNNNFYYRHSGDRYFMGQIKIINTSETAGSVTYKGTFKEDLIGKREKEISCVGDINIVRHQKNNQVEAQLTQIVKSGTNCPSIGQTFKVTLVEPLPVADKNGNFTSQNSDNDLSETAGFLTWPAWQVVSSDGELNCRAQPNAEAAVKFVFRAGRDRLKAETRGASAFQSSNGATWMRTVSPKGICYVRANSKFIKPISIPN
ncbi:hypothetical protein [Kamptonema sp. UHCC 0994]|uniref:hypothetical protein n=1 Tax=Kamptonema sp. UHCC 0994 TaxID=3031329 RepID=UPI0023BAA83B|nr:hypothetical protein [Kamptonema sp. UHCC 0994]MDF0556404.1 hypothetical protein [Kamptonema sp. UHCC 0994]